MLDLCCNIQARLCTLQCASILTTWTKSNSYKNQCESFGRAPPKLACNCECLLTITYTFSTTCRDPYSCNVEIIRATYPHQRQARGQTLAFIKDPPEFDGLFIIRYAGNRTTHIITGYGQKVVGLGKAMRIGQCLKNASRLLVIA